MTSIQAESVITRIIKQIVQQCFSKGHDVSETFVAFIVKAVVLDPDAGFLPDKPLDKEDIKKLIKLCVDRITDQGSPSIDTIKMQVFFELNHLKKTEFLNEHHRILEKRLEPILREVMESRARLREELEATYQNIISALLLRSGLGSVTNMEVIRETTAALQSIFPQTDIVSFLTASTNHKRKQLYEFTGLVTGIRLYNKDCNKGGAGIDDLPHLLNEGVPITLKTVCEEIKKANELATIYTNLFLKLSTVDSTPDINTVIKTAKDMEITPENLKAAVVNARQYEKFLKIIESELNQMSTSVRKVIDNFKDCMKKLHILISDRPAVPSNEVYPGFLQLANYWTCFQDEMVYLSVLTSTLNTLQTYFIGRHSKWTKENMHNLISESEHNGLLSEECCSGNQCTVLHSITDESSQNIECEGFCIWSLVRHQGLLVPADIKMGVILLAPENKVYAFSTPEAAKDFVMEPDNFLKAIPEVIRRLPELIPILKLNYLFSKGISYTNSQFTENSSSKVDSGTQTVLHPIESYIDKNYQWNEWELRKNALKLANLRKKATTSVQTILSNWRRDNATQVYLMKDSSSATKEDSYTQVPKPSVFIHGLRGCGAISSAPNATNAVNNQGKWTKLYRETTATTIDLTIPVEQQLLGGLHKITIS
ncbi:Cilia- and flagella-associated protein [Schistosoma japonicum]|nr:Cilia- and flagella-associated protein [Schistosoma japonicum]